MECTTVSGIAKSIEILGTALVLWPVLKAIYRQRKLDASPDQHADMHSPSMENAKRIVHAAQLNMAHFLSRGEQYLVLLGVALTFFGGSLEIAKLFHLLDKVCAYPARG
jgi:hypothetical protein